ncbi:hypothetical protein [Melghirimyces algeriensis]|uniref:Uncharacterized protein n=1 Tax=Melghirimyces algeriensis TaxID=910412 RepID=A0A521F7R6_9BACL|nr:hypothetical protein [Melghirimyces algeriensis]SMO92229.1 hypothetical protein SAMN06264849_11443 [Melghirimyces algeriensis]
MSEQIKVIHYFKSFENELEYLVVEIDGEKRMFESTQDKKDEGTRNNSGC